MLCNLMCVDVMWTLLMKYIVTPYETSPRQSLHSTEPSRQHELIDIITGALIGNLRLQFYVELDNGLTAGRRIQIVIRGNDHAVRFPTRKLVLTYYICPLY